MDPQGSLPSSSPHPYTLTLVLILSSDLLLHLQSGIFLSVCEICGSCGGEDDDVVLGCDAMWTLR
jgi:hypothetical protein